MKTDIWTIRRETPSAYQPSLVTLTELACALAEAAENARRGGRPNTAGAYDKQRAVINAIIEASPIEHAWRKDADK